MKDGKKGQKTMRKSHRMCNRSRKMGGGKEFDRIQLTIKGYDFDFSSLPRYTKLKKLTCSDCPMLTTLPNLPTTLKELSCSNCPMLTALPNLPTTLTILGCFNCPMLTALPNLPATLYLLTCSNCPITELPKLPATLTILTCYDCPLLTALPNLPATLTRLDCSYCPLLTALPELPARLTKLVCSQEYFIDKYDYEIDSKTIKRFRNDPITIKRIEIEKNAKKQPHSPPKAPSPSPPKAQSPSPPKASSPPKKQPRCPNGTIRNKKTGNCETKKQHRKSHSPPKAPSPPKKQPHSPPKAPSPPKKQPHCPNGTIPNKKTGNCESKKEQGCPSYGKEPTNCYLMKQDEAKKSFRKQSLVFHPDKNITCLKDATKKFQKLNSYCNR